MYKGYKAKKYGKCHNCGEKVRLNRIKTSVKSVKQSGDQRKSMTNIKREEERRMVEMVVAQKKSGGGGGGGQKRVNNNRKNKNIKNNNNNKGLTPGSYEYIEGNDPVSGWPGLRGFFFFFFFFFCYFRYFCLSFCYYYLSYFTKITDNHHKISL